MLGEDDRAVVGQLLRLGVRVVVAGDEDQTRAGVQDPARQLRLERDILSKAAAWFARETGTIPSGSSGS